MVMAARPLSCRSVLFRKIRSGERIIHMYECKGLGRHEPILVPYNDHMEESLHPASSMDNRYLWTFFFSILDKNYISNNTILNAK